MSEEPREKSTAARAVLFDLDGTLLDTLQDLSDAVNAALSHLGHPVHPTDAYRTMVGSGIEHLLEAALPAERRNGAEVAVAVDLASRAYADGWRNATHPYEGVPELLAELDRRRIPTAVISNKPHPFTLLAVRHFFPNHPFGAVLGDRPGVPRKPDPAMALEAAAIMGVPPGDCLLLGDSGSDMRAARSAGMTAAAALWGFRGRAELESAGAEVLLTKPLGLLTLL